MSATERQVFRFEGFTLDTAGRTLRTADREVELRPKSFDVLCCLVERAGELVTKDEIMRRVWAGVTVTDNSLTRCLSDIRLSLGDREQRLIKTVARRGYVFVAPIMQVADAPLVASTAAPTAPEWPVAEERREPAGRARAVACPRCRSESPIGAKFCEECGASLTRLCPNCGSHASVTARFCPECAGPLAPATEDPGFASPMSYTPRRLAEKILIARPALEGERKQITVLCADILDAMALLVGREPEEGQRLLNGALERVIEAVHRYDGMVNKVMGGKVLALFGAPLAHEDHALRAAHAALRMQEGFRRYAAELRRRHGIEVALRVGLNSGDVLVRAIANDLHMDYAAEGLTTHLAVRMEQLARPWQVLMTADTRRLAADQVLADPAGPVTVPGLGAPIETFALTGAPPRSRVQAATRALTEFVGRDRELHQLRDAVARAGAGQGQLVALAGEPGVGKSRLVHELARPDQLRGWLVLRAGAVSYGKLTSYLPVVELLKSYFAIEDGDDASTLQEKVAGKLRTIDVMPDDKLPALLSLLDVPMVDPRWMALDPPQRRRAILDAVKLLLLWESRRQPLLLIVEDLHWIDSETQALLDDVVRSLPAARLLLLVSYRPEYRHSWESRAAYTLIRLHPLQPDTAAQILGTLLGPDPGLDPLTRVLIARTEGNPFFLEESVRALIETGDLAGARGRYRLARPAPGLQVPATVQAVLAARIDRLAADDKVLLQTASAIGRTVPFYLLSPLVRRTDEELQAALERLQTAEFLYELISFPDREFIFKHALTHDVAYGSLPNDRRRALHREVMISIERRDPEQALEHVELLAHHALRGEVWDKAVIYLRQAGAKAFARSSNREALADLEQALSALVHVPASREAQEQAIDLRVDLRNALYPLAEFARIEALLREAEDLARTLGDQRRLGWVSAYLSSLYLTAGGNAREAGGLAQVAETIAEQTGDVPLKIAAEYYLAWACYIAGDFARTQQICRTMMQSLAGERARERFGVVVPAIQSRVYLARALAEQGVFDEADIHGRDAVQMAEAFDHPFSLSWACLGLAHVKTIRGEVDEAARLLERAIACCREWRIDTVAPIVMALQGHVQALSGRSEDGVALLDQALAGYEAARMDHFHAMSIAQAGEACLLAGRKADARARAERALALARRRGERGFEAWALRLLGEIGEAGQLSAALALASELGMRPLAAHCHSGLARLLERSGDPAAQEHQTTAVAMYREMRMVSWLRQP